MTRLQFPLSSTHLELLLAFEQSKGLAQLAEKMGRDPSVVSRSLQRIAEEFPVLAKVNGRWEITPLGRQVNVITQKFLEEQQSLLARKDPAAEACFSPHALLLIINAQAGLLDATLGGRNNSEAEKNIAALLKNWRQKKKPILHVKHVSDNPKSSFYRSGGGSEFLPLLGPQAGEDVLEKTKSSAFADTDLAEALQKQNIEALVLAGFTANECIDATARHAAEFGFATYVVGDATAMFDISGPDGKLIKAERVHRLTLANLNALYAKVIETKVFF